MKVETGSFTPSTSGVTLVLNDSNLQVKGVFFQIAKAQNNVNAGTGFDDGVSPKSIWALDDTNKDSGRSQSYSIYAKKYSGSVQDAVKGKVDGAKFSNVGEIELSFATADAGWVVDFMAIGD